MNNSVTDNKEHYLQLIQKAEQAAQNYYNNSINLLMEDDEYDLLVEEIETLSKNNGWTEGQKLFQQIAAGTTPASTNTVIHTNPMLSLNKANKAEEVTAFINRVTANSVNTKIVCEPKLDGSAISVKYVNGKIVQIATRGTGTIGENITTNLKNLTINGLPHTIPTTKDIEVRGEIYVTNQNFIKAVHSRMENAYKRWVTRNPDTPKYSISTLIEQAKKNRYENGSFTIPCSAKNQTLDFKPENYLLANPRNAIAGYINTDTITYDLIPSFAVYDIVTTQKTDDSYTKTLEYAKLLGFTPAAHLLSDTLREETVTEIIKTFGEMRILGLDYPTDGIVLKVDSLKTRNLLGEGNKHPNWAIAYKYAPETNTTIVTKIVTEIGRTGRLSLIAHTKPVMVDGSQISKASLHNASWLQEKDIRVGDTVQICKANDVIPYINKAILEKRPPNTTKWEPPTACPLCGTKWDKTTLLWRCPEPTCGEIKSITHAAGRDYLDIEWLAEKIVTNLYDQKLIKDIGDVFYLTEKQIATLPTGKVNKTGENAYVGEVVAKKIFENIQEAKKRPLSAVLASLNIRTLGKTFGRRITNHYPNMNAILKATAEELAQIDGIAETKAAIIHEGLRKQLPLIKKLAAAGVTMTSPKRATTSATMFTNKKVCITGAVPGYSREQLKDLLNTLQIIPTSSVTSATDYLIAAEDAHSTSKYVKAKQLGTTIITPEQFLKMIKQ